MLISTSALVLTTDNARYTVNSWTQAAFARHFNITRDARAGCCCCNAFTAVPSNVIFPDILTR